MIEYTQVENLALSANLVRLRKIFMKSLYSAKPILKGETLTDQCIIPKKPGTGIPANQIKNIVGKKAKINIETNTMLRLEDLE